jgi:hypothetical protein
MAPVHRLAIELSDQRAAARDFYKYTKIELKDRSLERRITAKRFSGVPGTFDSLGVKVPWPT